MSGEPQKIDIHDLEDEIYGILNPEPDEPGDLPDFPPHPRLSSIHGLDISYYHKESQIYDPKYPTSIIYINRDRTFERVLRGASNPLHKHLTASAFRTVCSSQHSRSLATVSSSITKTSVGGIYTVFTHLFL